MENISNEDLFDHLDTLNDKLSKKEKCCLIQNNHLYDNGTIVCKICSNFITNIIDSPEWRYYGSSDSRNSNPTRCGMPVNQLLPKSSLGTSVSHNYSSEVMNRVGMYQRWNSMPYKERSLYLVFTEIQQKCNKNNLPEIIIQCAQSLYTIISETKISRGNNRKGIIAACVFNACKECNVPRSANELAEMFEIDQKIMTRGIKKYIEIMRLSKRDKSRIVNMKSIDINDFIERFSHKLNLNHNDISSINKIVQKCFEFKIDNDNTPPAMAAGCIYLYVKLNNSSISKKEIANVSKISEVTINKCYKKLSENENINLYNK